MTNRKSHKGLELARQIILVLLLMIAVFVASTGGIQNPDMSRLFEGISISITAAVLSLFFLAGIEKRKIIDIDEIAEIISKTQNQHIIWVERNMDVPAKAWVELIEDLDTTSEPAFFLGTKLSWWTKTGTYLEPLQHKLEGRFRKIIREKSNNGKEYTTYILLTDQGALSIWTDLIYRIIEKVIANKNEKEKSTFRDMCRRSVTIKLVPKESVRYSAVLSGSKLFITNYISKGGSDDCPTLEIRKDSVIWRLYQSDMEYLLTKASTRTS